MPDEQIREAGKDQRKEVKQKIDELTIGYKDKAQFCVDKLAEGMAFIA